MHKASQKAHSEHMASVARQHAHSTRQHARRGEKHAEQLAHYQAGMAEGPMSPAAQAAQGAPDSDGDFDAD